MGQGSQFATLVGVVWAVLAAWGLGWAYRYAATPAPLLPVSAISPAESVSTDQPLLVAFLHPQCGCSRATLSELERLGPELNGRARIWAYFYAPEGRSPSWVRSDLWQRASRIPGAIAFEDRDGKIARRYRASASGEIFLYDRSGHLVFHGGITPARGHEGESPGRRAISDWFAGRSPSSERSPVFGCDLRSRRPAREAAL